MLQLILVISFVLCVASFTVLCIMDVEILNGQREVVSTTVEEGEI